MLALGVARLRQAPALAGVEESWAWPGPCGRRRARRPRPRPRRPGSRGRRPAAWAGWRRGEGRAADEHAARGGGDAGGAKTEEALPARAVPMHRSMRLCISDHMPGSQTVTRLAAVPRAHAARPPRGAARRRDRAARRLRQRGGHRPTKPPDPAKSQGRPPAGAQAPRRDHRPRGPLPRLARPVRLRRSLRRALPAVRARGPQRRLHRPDGVRGDPRPPRRGGRPGQRAALPRRAAARAAGRWRCTGSSSWT